MKTKIIESGYKESFENNLNKFIQDKKVIDIKYDTTTEPKEPALWYSALVLYEEQLNLSKEEKVSLEGDKK